MSPPPRTYQIEVYGLLQEESFHIAKCCIDDLQVQRPGWFDDAVVKPMLECEWMRFVESKKAEIKGEMWAFADSVICFVDGALTGNHTELLQWAGDEFDYEDFRPLSLYGAIANEAYRDYFLNNERSFVFMDVSIDGEVAGRLLFELFSDVCPKTCANFRSLCAGDRGELASGLKLHYLNTPIHRVVPNGWVQGGDILHGRGDAGESVYGETFEDENFAVRHATRGTLGMANKGRHSNGSQFYVTLQPTPWMDCQYVAFGTLIEGADMLAKLERLPTFNERPKSECKISACGIFEPST